MNKKTPRSNRRTDGAKRLVSYTTAAGLGAFWGAQEASALVVFTDIEDVVLSTAPADPAAVDEQSFATFDVNGDGVDDLSFRARYRNNPNRNFDGPDGTAGTAGAGDLTFATANGAQVLVPLAQSYYLGPFLAGDAIGPSTPVPLAGYPDYQLFLTLPYRSLPAAYYPYDYPYSYSYNGGQFSADLAEGVAGYVGFSFPIAGNTFFGWAEIETNGPGAAVAELTIKSFAYETLAGTAITAGDTVGAPAGPGDFNLDGEVNAADYVVFRDSIGGAFEPDDYDEWAENFDAGSPVLTASVGAASVPEATSVAMLAAGAGALAFRRRRVSNDSI